ncbi:DinB family protein [Mucilaginibacter robiniae]|uniref:DinB family protein n=1 Tax=Mucilaginibacter robiniae TaxID=2728022 RepID=A0A7L5E8Q5_9SPHI|nr:DinB family protein [Mucilaginibacter robiniae]QJD96756.1 DinB family protein [Mucilaginibacter robiniae]
MNLADEYKAIKIALDNYRSRLDEVTEEQFTETPPIGGWSLAEVYSHILQADLGSTIAAEKCCLKTGVHTRKGLNWKGKLVFLLNRFPPGKRKAPAAIANLTQKISKEEARNLIVRLRKRVDSIMPMLHNAPQDVKISHPGLGMLDARQWLKFLRIHTEHHIKQLDRIEKSLKQE